MNVIDYIEKAERKLNSKGYYHQLSKDQSAANNETVNNVTESFQKGNLITKNIAERLKTTSPQTPRFYIQPKIHKQGNPRRPAISSIDCHTSNISKYVDYHLQSIVQQIPAYIQDTSNFLRKINKIEKIPDNSYLVSLDVRSSYTSIPNSEGIKYVKGSTENFPRRTVATKVIPTFLSLILTLNNFVFNCKNYLEIKACAMGTICAPAYANIFMDHFERKHIHSFLEGFSLSYLRFIDSIFFIWTGRKDQLIAFLNNLNRKHNSIKFEYKISESSIPFPDTEVYIKKNYTPRFIGKKQTDKTFCILIQSNLYH